MKIPFLSFDYQIKLMKKDFLSACEQVIDSGWYIMGEYLKKFEKEYASLSNTSHAVGVANGLDAIILSLKALGISENDKLHSEHLLHLVLF